MQAQCGLAVAFPSHVTAHSDTPDSRGEQLICFSLRIIVPPAKRRELMTVVGTLLAPTRVQPDCLSARLYVDAEDENAVTLVQEWASRRELDRYLTSEAGKQLLEAMESSAVTPGVRFDTIRHRGGMEVFSQARSRRSRPGL